MIDILIRANDFQKQEVLSKAIAIETQYIWYENEVVAADLYIDFLFKPNDNIFKGITEKPVLVHAIEYENTAYNTNFICFNGWNGFFKHDAIECATNNQLIQKEFTLICEKIGWKTIWVNHQLGLVTPKIIGMIINEAFFALQDGVATKNDINTAMKLGTNYPYGPFEWADIIGLQHIYALLLKLSIKEVSYTPCKGICKAFIQ